MATVTNRITSKDIVIKYIPNFAEDTHVETFNFPTATGGTFRLRVNGELTDAITYSATPATLVSNIQAKIDLLDRQVDATDPALTVAGSALTAITLTGDADGFFEFRVESSALTGGTVGDEITHLTTTQGSLSITISAQASSFETEESVDTVDVTAISEYEETVIPVKSSMTFSVNLFEANEDWQIAVRAGNMGTFYVYEQGVVTGRKYFAFKALIESVSKSFPDHEKVEFTISGRRIDEMVVPFNSVV